MPWKLPDVEAVLRLHAPLWQEAKTQLAKSGIHNRFEADFELRFVLFLAENIDGLSSSIEQKFTQQIATHVEWSAFHLRMLNDRVHRLPTFDLSQLRLCHEFSALAQLAYQFAVNMCLIDGDLNEEERTFLSNLRLNLFEDQQIPNDIEVQSCKVFGVTQDPSLKSTDNSNPSGGNVKESQASPSNIPEKSLEESLAALDELIGLESVKAEIKRLVSFLDIQKRRESLGLPKTQLSLHMVFTGSPGTGKTTVARLVAQIYKSMGILAKGHLVETDRSGLVGQYVGHTDTKTHAIVNKALDGILFIDEAYALVKESENDFGKEAIDALVKRLEDDRHRLVVIVAGYQKEMEQFINTNPGLKSRFNTFITFEDFSQAELCLIFESLCKKHHYQLADEAKEKLPTLFQNAIEQAKGNFGNARFARNLFEGSLRYQAFRLSQIKKNLDKQDLMTLHLSDLEQSLG
jgi:type VII secretion ATPase EccA